MRQISLKKNTLLLIVITISSAYVFNMPAFSKPLNKISNQQFSNNISSSATQKNDELTSLIQKYNELIKELDNAKSVISSLKSTINEKSYKADESLKENNKLNNRIADITKTYEMDKENYLEDMQNKFDELELAKCKILELTTRINQLENYSEKNNLKKVSNKAHKKSSIEVEDFHVYNNNKNEALENYRTTVLDQSKQLSKCNTEIEKVHSKMKKYDSFIDNIILNSKKIAKDSGNNEAHLILTLLSNAEIDRPEIYIELIKLFQAMGLTEESNKAREIMYNLYPSLKKDDNP